MIVILTCRLGEGQLDRRAGRPGERDGDGDRIRAKRATRRLAGRHWIKGDLGAFAELFGAKASRFGRLRWDPQFEVTVHEPGGRGERFKSKVLGGGRIIDCRERAGSACDFVIVAATEPWLGAARCKRLIE